MKFIDSHLFSSAEMYNGAKNRSGLGPGGICYEAPNAPDPPPRCTSARQGVERHSAPAAARSLKGRTSLLSFLRKQNPEELFTRRADGTSICISTQNIPESFERSAVPMLQLQPRYRLIVGDVGIDTNARQHQRRRECHVSSLLGDILA